MKTFLVILFGLALCDVASAGGCHRHRDIYCCDSHGRFEFDSMPDGQLEFTEVGAIMDTGTFEVRNTLDEQKIFWVRPRMDFWKYFQ